MENGISLVDDVMVNDVTRDVTVADAGNDVTHDLDPASSDVIKVRYFLVIFTSFISLCGRNFFLTVFLIIVINLL